MTSSHPEGPPTRPATAGSGAWGPEILVDLDAVTHNVDRLRDQLAADPRVGAGVEPAALMVVVKADAYGHGMAEVARTARAAGVPWLGVATTEEAVALRAAGDGGRLLCWLHPVGGGESLAAALAADVDVTAYSLAELAEIDRALPAGATARVQLKVDTGLSRGGATAEEWPALVAAAREAEVAGRITVTGIWSHFACSDEPEHPANDAQERAFRTAVAIAEEAGLRPEVRHLANSAGALLRPSARFELVRCGLAVYGLDPAPQATLPPDLDLRPAMTASAPLVLTKQVPAGAGVSYGHLWHADRETVLGLVQAGYGDGVLRHASNRAEVWLAGARRPIRGRVCMDQFVVDLGAGEDPRRGADEDADEGVEEGAAGAARGDRVVLFGPGTSGEPTAQDWATACGTISYEVVTRLGGRFTRRYRSAIPRPPEAKGSVPESPRMQTAQPGQVRT